MTLVAIQKLAKVNKKQAEDNLLLLTRSIFPRLNIKKVTIAQKSYSLNSVFGFITIKNKDYFFKFHSEEGEEKTLKEYYASEILKKAGLPIIMPILKSTKPGKQFLIYQKINKPTVFEVMDKMDRNYLKNKRYDKKLRAKILAYELAFDKLVLKKSLKTLKTASAQTFTKEEINQFFYRRLVSKNSTPRLDLFYKNKFIALPNNKKISFEKIKKLKWTINGIEFEESLEQIIDEAKRLLNPFRLKTYPVVVGHGDDHNGNKFLTNKGFLYYDAAVAGQHQYALLTFIKSTFHDCLAHPLWLYDAKDFKVSINFAIKGDRIKVETDYDWEKWAPMREELLWIKIKNLWLPLLQKLKNEGLLEKEWQNFIRKALFACPFLVKPAHSLFTLSQCVAVGSKSKKDFMEKYFDL